MKNESEEIYTSSQGPENPQIPEVIEDLEKTLENLARFEHAGAEKKAKTLIEKLKTNPQQFAKKVGEHTIKLLTAIAFATSISARDVDAASLELEDTKAISSEDQEIIGKELGLDIEQLTRDFKVEVLVRTDPKEPYIVHIGQYHHSFLVKEGPKTFERVTETQESIGRVMSYFAETKKTGHVFVEGLTSKETGELQKKFIQTLEKRLNEIPDPKENPASAIITFSDTFRNYQGNIGHGGATGLVVLTLLKEKLKYIEEYADTTHLETLIPSEKIDEFKAAKDVITRVELAPIPLNREDALYVMGAGFVASYENKLEALPAETEEGNAAAISALKAHDKVSREYRTQVNMALNENEEIKKIWNVIQNPASSLEDRYLASIAFSNLEEELIQKNPELKKLKEKLDESNEKTQQAIFTDREKIVIQRIHEFENELKKGESIILVLYGNMHSLTEEIEAHNKFNTTADADYNLIKLSPLKGLREK